MGRKKKAAVAATPQETVKMFEFGDLIVECSKCGKTTVLQKGLQHGIQILVVPTDESKLQMICPACENSITLRFIEGVKPEETTTEKADENIQEEVKQEETV